MRILTVFALLLAPVLSAATVQGRAIMEDAGLPGATITLRSADVLRRTIAGAEGRYSFTAVAPGPYELTIELSGLETETREIDVPGEILHVEDVQLHLDPAVVMVTFSCGASACTSGESETPFDRPMCTDHDLNSALMESMKNGDVSAIELLRQRYRTTFTYAERHRIASALLGRVPNDREYWNELSARVTEAIRFAYVDDEPSLEFTDWCMARGVDPEDYRAMTLGAIPTASIDRRARPLLLRALESNDLQVMLSALYAVIDLRDESFLPKIEKALERFPDDAEGPALWLATFGSDAADRVAMKFLPEDELETYREERRLADCETFPCDP